MIQQLVSQPQGIAPVDVAMIFDLLEQCISAGSRVRLKAFAEELPHLRGEYKHDNVVVDYGNQNIKGAYLLAYYPHHIDTAFRILKSINADVATVLGQRDYRALFLAGGPLPELVALALLGANAPERLHGIIADCVDLHPWGARETNEIVRTICPSVVEEICCKRMDLRNDALALVDEYDLVMMQNCLNEMEVASHLLENVRTASASLRPGGYCVFSDLAFYDNDLRLRQLRNALESDGLVLEEETPKQSYTSYFADPPRWLRRDLYGPSGEIPKRNMRTATLVMRKPFR